MRKKLQIILIMLCMIFIMHPATVRADSVNLLESSNEEIATVNSKGKITAKAKGTCYVYAYAQNGVYKRICSTVFADRAESLTYGALVI